jgi:exodeoxyribonuclease VII large subunit
LDARFNPVAVRGEISGFSRASSGHCYFTLKDGQGQLRCAMFRRAAGLLEFTPRDGDLVEVQGRLAVYEPRGDLQLVVESLSRAGQGAWFEQFLRLKAKLDAEGLFDAGRKRAIPTLPRAIGVVTSLGAAALHDVVTALARRAPHVPVVLAPAAVQGPQAAGELIAALRGLYQTAAAQQLDLILLVRGGGAVEDLAAFNDEALARTIAASPVPVVSGVGHETDFTIADFCADLRAPTPTAAAELASLPRADLLSGLAQQTQRLQRALRRSLDGAAQRADMAATRLGRPSARTAEQHQHLGRAGDRLRHAVQLRLQRAHSGLDASQERRASSLRRRLDRAQQRLHQHQLRMDAMDPRVVLRRGYAWLTDTEGSVIRSAAQTTPGQALRATLAEGEVDLSVSKPRLL